METRKIYDNLLGPEKERNEKMKKHDFYHTPQQLVVIESAVEATVGIAAVRARVGVDKTTMVGGKEHELW